MRKKVALSITAFSLSIAVFSSCSNSFDNSEISTDTVVTSEFQTATTDTINESYIIEESSYVIDSISFDIDNDGIIEECTITDGPTSGIFTIVITASVNGTVKYKNTFGIMHGYDLKFAENDGVLQIYMKRFNPNTQEPDSVYHNLYIEHNKIVIDDLNENEGYWGDSEWNSELS